MCGYLIGLSSPSVTERITTLAACPRGRINAPTGAIFTCKNVAIGYNFLLCVDRCNKDTENLERAERGVW